MSTSADFNPDAMLGTCSTVNTTFTPTVLGDCFPQSLGTYYWRVMAMDGPRRRRLGRHFR